MLRNIIWFDFFYWSRFNMGHAAPPPHPRGYDWAKITTMDISLPCTRNGDSLKPV